jgi:hypothetical protein
MHGGELIFEGMRDVIKGDGLNRKGKMREIFIGVIIRFVGFI